MENPKEAKSPEEQRDKLLITIVAVINALLVLIGVAMIALAAVAVGQTKGQPHGTIYGLGVLGIILLLCGTCGCVAAIMANPACLCMYGCCLIMLTTKTIVFAILFLLATKEDSPLGDWAKDIGKSAKHFGPDAAYHTYSLVLGLVCLGTAVIEVMSILFVCCLYNGMEYPEEDEINELP